MFNKNKKTNKVFNLLKIVVLPILLIIGLIFLLFYDFDGEDKAKYITYKEFLTKVENKEISKVVINKSKDKIVIVDNNKITYTTDNPKYDLFTKELLEKGIKVEHSGNFSFISAILAMVIVIFLIKKFNPIKVSPINKNIGHIYDSEKNIENSITFDNVIGLGPIKKDLQILVEFLKSPKKFAERGAELSKGIILYGAPGTGKTLLAKAIAGEANVSFISVNASEFVELYVGVGALRVRELFERAKSVAPCILFIDELDAVACHRGGSKENQEQRQTLNALLSEMDGFNQLEGVLVIAATNRLEDIDGALLRPGRFGTHISVPSPSTPEERLELIELYSKDKSFDDTVDFKSLSKELIGFSPADIKDLLNEAVLVSIQDRKSVVDKLCIDKAMYKKVLKGHMKEVYDKDKERLKLIAWHEAGHALMGTMFDIDIKKISIVPSTSGAGGFNIVIPNKTSLLSKQDLENEVKMCYGGVVSEYLLLGDKKLVTTGASNDIKRASSIISDMITNYGMSGEYGLLNLNTFDTNKTKILEIANKIAIDIENETLELLKKYKPLLQRIADELLEKETIEGSRLTEIICDYDKEVGV